MKKNKRDTEIIETALERFKLLTEANKEIREEAIKDLKFVKGDHWPNDIKAARRQDNRPTLTINKMPQFVRNLTNDQKQNRPRIQVSPVDDKGDIETADVLQGVIRNIENVSDAEYAYDKAFECAVRSSFGFFRITTKYTDPKSFDLEPSIEVIDNQFKAGIDPYSILPDGSDAKWGFVWDSMPKDEFKAEYGESKLAEHADWNDLTGGFEDGWGSDDEVRVAEYFYKDFKRVKLLQLSDGESYLESELPDKNEDGTYTVPMEVIDQETQEKFEETEILKVEQERWTKTAVVKWLKMNAHEILEETEWPGSHIPIIPVYGDCLNIDGQVVRESVIRHARDPQRILNFWASSEAEAITLAPKAPFIGAEGQFTGHENKWKNANTKNYPYLEYKPTTHEGQMAPPPQRNSFEPPVMAITNARVQANEDIKATTGIYDASLGQRSNESSGIAIQRRNQQAATSNFHFVDNLAKSIRHAGRILVEIIPKLYDTERIVRVLGEDNERKLMRINSPELLKDQKRSYNFTFGKYDVVVATGPSYETKRQEARDSMVSMAGANPKFMDIAGDLMVQNMDWPGAQEISKRLKRTMAPELVSDQDEQMPPQAQAAIQQLTQQLEMASNELNQIKDIQHKDILKIESNERIAAMKVQADMKTELVKIEGKNSELLLKQEIEIVNERLKQLGAGAPVGQMIQAQPQQEYEGLEY